MANLIALITDFGLSDPYTGVMKAILLSRNPRAQIVDITHDVPPQDLAMAAGWLEESYKFFPKKTVFVVVVDPGVGTNRRILAVRTRDYYFVGPDNGVLSKAVKREGTPVEIRIVANARYFSSPSPSNTFHGRDIMAPVAGMLSTPGGIEIFRTLGPRIHHLTQLRGNRLIKRKGEIIGVIIRFDRFGNAMTSIPFNVLAAEKWRNAVIDAGGLTIGRLSTAYADSKKGPVALINSSGNLEIAVPNGSAEKALRLKAGQKVRVVYG